MTLASSRCYEGFELIRNFLDLAPYADQIVAVRGDYYFENTRHAFAFDKKPERFAHISKEIFTNFKPGPGYHLNTLYRVDGIRSVTAANVYTLSTYILCVRRASNEELRRIKSVVDSSLAQFSSMVPEACPKDVGAVLDRQLKKRS